ncbi:MAG: helix-turn-helix domain-containing protein [Rudaea sp.]|nr:helix-turn-helix domain-containing protein [Rudaea sp.]
MNASAPVTRYQLAEIGALLADPSRAAILLALIDGSARPAGELGLLAGVAPATASAHLRKLCDGGLLGVLARGRHRYYRLAGEDIAHLVETLALTHTRSARSGGALATDPALSRARTCYHHLAGRLGVALFERLRGQRGLMLGAAAVHLSERGRRLLIDSGLVGADDAIEKLPGRSCLDWTERRFHLAGALGTLLTRRLFDAGWLRRRRDTRALGITPRGHSGFTAMGLDLDPVSRR